MMMVEQQPVSAVRRARQAIALLIYTLELILSYLSDAVGWIAAWTAGDD